MTNIRVEEQRTDGIVNAFSQLGDPAGDRHTHTMPSAIGMQWSEELLDRHYEHDRIARRIVDRLPRDCTREGWSVRVKDSNVPDLLSRERKKLKERWTLRKAHRLARQTGGAGIVMVTDDNNPLEQPLDLKSIRSLRAMHVLDRFEMRPVEFGNDFDSPLWREPTLYQITASTVLSLKYMGAGPSSERGGLTPGQFIHGSRVIPFYGSTIRFDRRYDYDGWMQPVLESVWEVLSDYGVAAQAIGSALHEFQYTIYFFKDLQKLLTGPNGEPDTTKFTQRLTAMKLSKSFIRAIAMDADRERAEQRSVNFTGLVEAFGVIQQEMSAATNYPISLLFGTPPQGFSTNDETALTSYNDHVSGIQEEDYVPAIERIVEVLLATKNKDPGTVDFEVHMNPLTQLGDDEAATVRKTVAETDQMNIKNGIYTPEEARKRHEATDFSVDLSLDTKDGLASFEDLDGDTPAPPPPEEEGPEPGTQSAAPPASGGSMSTPEAAGETPEGTE